MRSCLLTELRWTVLKDNVCLLNIYDKAQVEYNPPTLGDPLTQQTVLLSLCSTALWWWKYRTTNHRSKDTIVCLFLKQWCWFGYHWWHTWFWCEFFLCYLPKLLLYEKNWLNRWKTSTLHEGEGTITNVQWRANLIAWANNMVSKDNRQSYRYVATRNMVISLCGLIYIYVFKHYDNLLYCIC